MRERIKKWHLPESPKTDVRRPSYTEFKRNSEQTRQKKKKSPPAA